VQLNFVDFLSSVSIYDTFGLTYLKDTPLQLIMLCLCSEKG